MNKMKTFTDLSDAMLWMLDQKDAKEKLGVSSVDIAKMRERVRKKRMISQKKMMDCLEKYGFKISVKVEI